MELNEKLELLTDDRESVIARFGGNMGLLEKFLNKFSGDPTYNSLVKAVGEKDYSLIEMNAHTLKGVAANLGLDRLSSRAAAIVNAVRNGEKDKVDVLMPELEEEYQRVIGILRS